MGATSGTHGHLGFGHGEFRHGRPDAFLITEAQPSYEEEHRRRVHRYLAIMAIRIPALVLSAWLYSVTGNWVIALAVLIGSIPIPWVAVIRANDRPRRRYTEPSRYTRTPSDDHALEQRPTRTIDG